MDLPKYVKDLKELLELMRRNDLAELEIEESGHRVRLRKTEPTSPWVVGPGTGAPISMAAFPGAAASGGGFAGLASGPGAAGGAASAGLGVDASAGVAPVEENLHLVKSPLVGTFYRSSSPEADPFVTEGDRIDDDRVLCIIEAMKVMNEIKAGVSGVLREVLVKNGEPVEFGQPLFKVELA